MRVPFCCKGLLAGIAALGLAACAVNQSTSGSSGTEAQPWFNYDVFGQELDVTRSSISDIRLNHRFRTNGNNLVVDNCSAVLGYKGTVAQADAHGFTVLQFNCFAAQLFLKTPSTFVSHWSVGFSEPLYRSFSDIAYPNPSGQDYSVTSNTHSTMADYVGAVDVNSIGDDFIVTSSNYINTKYQLIAKADFNYDGIEDWLIRMDWQLQAEEGVGVEWVALTKLTESSKPMILWRDW